MEYEEKKIDNLQKTISTMVNIDEARKEFLGSDLNLDSKNKMSKYSNPIQMASEFNDQFFQRNGFGDPTLHEKRKLNKSWSPAVNPRYLHGTESAEIYEAGLVTRPHHLKSKIYIPVSYKMQNRMKRGNRSMEFTSPPSYSSRTPLNNVGTGQQSFDSSSDAMDNMVSVKGNQVTEEFKTFPAMNVTPFNVEADSANMAFSFHINAQPETNYTFRIERNALTVSSTKEQETFSNTEFESNVQKMTMKDSANNNVTGYLPQKWPRNSRGGNTTFQNSIKAVEKKAAVNMGAVSNRITETDKKTLDLKDSDLTFPKNFSLNNTENLKMVYNVIAPLFKSIQAQSNKSNQWLIRNGSIVANYIETANQDGFWYNGVFYAGKKGDYSAIYPKVSCEEFFKLLNKYPFTVAILLAFCCAIIVVILAIIFLRGHTKRKTPQNPFILKFLRTKKNDKDKPYSALKSPQSSSSPSTSSQDSKNEAVNGSGVRQKSDPKRLAVNHGPMDIIRGMVGRFRDKTEGASALAKIEHDRRKAKSERHLMIQAAEDEGKRPERKGFFNWIKDRVSNVMHPAFGERKSEDESEIDSADLRERWLMKKPKKQKHSLFWQSPTSKQSFADLHTVISGMDLTSSSGCCAGSPEQASRSELLSRVVATGGESRKIDQMLMGQEWDRSFYITHGIETLGTKPQHFMEHEAKDRETFNLNRMKAAEAQSMGILSGTSSTHSLLNQIGKSINKAECLSRHPKPLPSYELKSRM